MVHSDEQVANINYIYQKNYPKAEGGAKEKLKERVTLVPKDYVMLKDDDYIYFGFRNRVKCAAKRI